MNSIEIKPFEVVFIGGERYEYNEGSNEMGGNIEIPFRKMVRVPIYIDVKIKANSNDNTVKG